MLISHKHRFVFVHNPKVGGTSIRDPLEPFCETNLRKKGVVDNCVQDITHLRVDQWTPEFVKAYQDGYYFFGVVKDPVEKFKSALSEITFQHGDFIKSLSTGQEDSTETAVCRMLNESVARYDWRFTHFTPQWCYFGLSPHNLLPGIEIFDLEEINNWWPNLGEKLGIALPSILPNIRESYHKPTDLGIETLSLISEIYHEDFLAFHYLNAMKPLLKETSAQRIEHVAKFGWNGEFTLDNPREEAMVENSKHPLRSAAFEMLQCELNKRGKT